MNITAIPPINKEQSLLNVVIETPAGSHYKYAYDIQFDIFKIKKILPLGTFFPFDFGFIPNTKGGDGVLTATPTEGKKTKLKLTHAGLETFPKHDPNFAKESFVQGWTYITGTSLENYLQNLE